MAQFKDITGQRFGRLVAIEVAPKPPTYKNRHTFWKCKCDCGKFTSVVLGALISGNTRSCGCLQKEIAGTTLRKEVRHW